MEGKQLDGKRTLNFPQCSENGLCAVVWEDCQRQRVRRAPAWETQHSSIGRNGCHGKRWSHLEKSTCVREEGSQWHRKRNNISKRKWIVVGQCNRLPHYTPSLMHWQSRRGKSQIQSFIFLSIYFYNKSRDSPLLFFMPSWFPQCIKRKDDSKKKKGKQTKEERKKWQMRWDSWREGAEMISFIKADRPRV